MARRVNTRFLVIFSVVVLGGVLAAFLVAGPVGKHLFRGKAVKQMMTEGEALTAAADRAASPVERREKYEGALRNYQQAVASEPRNPDLYVRLGDVLYKMAPYDPASYLSQARGAWEKALEINPDYLPALRRLMDFYYAQLEIGDSQAGVFTRLRERAGQVHKLDPNDVRAHALVNIAVLRQWLSNIETPAGDVDAAVGDLAQLIEKNATAAERPEMVSVLATARAQRGLEAKRAGQKDADDKLAEAARTFDDAIKGHEGDADLHYRYVELLAYVIDNGRSKEIYDRYMGPMRQQVEEARKLADAKKDPKLFAKAYLMASRLAAQQGDTKRAEELLAEVYKEVPDDQQVRLAMARHWRGDPAHRDEAIAILEKPIAASTATGPKALLDSGLELQTLADLANMYVDRFTALKEADRPAEMKRLEATYDRMAALTRGRDRSEVLKVRGKLELLRGGKDAAVRAIQTFEKAQAQFGLERGGAEDPDLNFLLGRAYFFSRQSGQAKAHLQKVVRVFPEHVPARLMLAQVLVAEGDLKGAKEHIDFLEKRTPDDPEFLRLKLATLKPGDAIEAKALFDRLPEDKEHKLDPAARRRLLMSKAQLAPLAPISSEDDAVRLYKLVLAEDPSDVEALQGVRSVLVKQGKKDEAVALLEAAQAKAKPGDADRIGLLLKQLKGASAAELKAAAEEVVKRQQDPLTRELKLYELQMAGGDRAAAYEHLRAAEQIKPDDARVLDQMFQFHAAAKDWDKAQWYVDRLAEQNADQAGGLIYRFRLAMARGQLDAATEHAREMTVRLKEFAPGWVFLGQAQQAAGKYDDAIASFTAALDKQSENIDAIEGMINCYYAQNKPEQALAYIQRGLRASPDNARLKEQWRNHQLTYGDPAVVIKPAELERDADPKNPGRWMTLGRAQLAAAQKKDAKSAKYAADAKATFAEAVKRWPGERAFWGSAVEVAQLTGDKAGGEALLKKMADQPEFKDSPDPAMMLADHYLRSGDPAAAEATIKQAIDRFPKNVDLRRRLAAYYTQTGRPADALKLLDPNSPDKMERQQVVEIYMLDKKFAEAGRLLDGLIAADPKDAQLQALRGVVLLNQQKPDEALAALNAALALDPKNLAALYTRGAMRLGSRTPQLDDAVKDLTAVRDLEPRHVEARVSLGEAYRQRQQYDLAARELEEALRLAPGRRDVRANLIGIYTNSFRPPAWTEAERLVNQAKQLDPRDVTWPRTLAGLYAQRGLYDRAVKELEAAFALDQQNAREIKGYQPAGDLIRDYLDVLEKARKYTDMASLTDRLLQDPNVAATEWWVYVKRAVARAKTGRKADAMADFQRALEIAFAYKNASGEAQGAIVDKLGETIDGPTAVARVGELAKAAKGADALRWKVVLSALQLRTGDRAKAVATMDEVRGQFGELDERGQLAALPIAGNVYMATYAMDGGAELVDKARRVYEELLAKRPDDLGALNNLANILAEHVKPPELPKALEYAQRAYELLSRQNADPATAANLLDTIGWVNVLAGGKNLDRGVEHLNNSLRATELPEAQYHLGVAMLRKNNPSEAKRSLLRAGELIQARTEAGQEVDKSLKGKVDDALAQAEKALFAAPRAGAP
jgi:tetratricopeptide (TPR) repeat protein